MKTDHLKRYPNILDDKLLAWNAADELMINHINSLDLIDKRVLVLNDNFGAIACNIERAEIVFYSDSFISHQAAKSNIDRSIHYINDLSELQGHFDFIFLHIPKNYSFLEDILCQVSGHLTKESKLICCSMIKHLAGGAFDLINKYFGNTSTSLARKKARLIFAEFEREPVQSPYPLEVNLDGFDFPITNHSNVFSREKLDIGTRFFLDFIPQGIEGSILDLGCGNGLVGIKAKIINPKAQIIFCDESKMALLSAAKNFSHISKNSGEYIWTNCFEVDTPKELDLVLCNPPFHQGHTIGDFVARQMFRDAKRALKAGGKLRVIGNNHLGYHISLKKIFGNVSKIGQNKKFVVLESSKR